MQNTCTFFAISASNSSGKIFAIKVGTAQLLWIYIYTHLFFLGLGLLSVKHDHTGNECIHGRSHAKVQYHPGVPSQNAWRHYTCCKKITTVYKSKGKDKFRKIQITKLIGHGVKSYRSKLDSSHWLACLRHIFIFVTSYIGELTI